MKLKKIIFEENFKNLENSLIVFSRLYRAIESLPKTILAYRTFFKRKNGRLNWFWLNDFLHESENRKIKIILEDRVFGDHQFGIAFSSKTDGYYRITLVIDTPQEYNETPYKFNTWFVNNILEFLRKNKSVFIHEYTHIQDFKKLKKDFAIVYKKINQNIIDYNSANELLNGLEEKSKEFEELKPKVELLRKILNKNYYNSPLETNAYFNQYMSGVLSQAKTTWENGGEDLFNKIFGNTPQEFSEKFYNRISITHKENFSEKTKRNFFKKSAIMYNVLKDYLRKKRIKK